MSFDRETATARGIAAAVAQGRLHPAAVAEAYLDRIAGLEPALGAFAHHDPAAVRRAARSGMAGPLAAVPFGVKDVIDTADMPTAYGSAAYAGWRPCRDAPVVHLARQAGALLMGKTVTTEFATAAPGRTVNPFDPARTPGGSSSGSAAALGAGLVLLAYGTQTSGSTIRPASYCGVVGYKATPGRIDRTAVKPLSGTLDVLGLMARDCRDLALLAGVAMRHPPVPGAGGMPRLGLFVPDLPEAPSAVAIAVAERAAGVLGAVQTVAAPPWWDGLGQAQAQVFGWEVSATLAPDRDLHWPQLQPQTHGFLERAGRMGCADWQAGLAARDAALADLDRLFGGCDLLITQPAPGEAPRGLGSTGPAAYNIRWTLLGCPCITVPAGLGPDGLPVGIQLVARPGQDALLLAGAMTVEDRLRVAGLPARPERMKAQVA